MCSQNKNISNYAISNDFPEYYRNPFLDLTEEHRKEIYNELKVRPEFIAMSKRIDEIGIDACFIESVKQSIS